MAREIKFRGRIRQGKWIVGEIISLNKHKYIAPNDGDWFDFIEWVPENVFHAPDSDKYEVEENTIGQFTGLHDKNGNEIYEGDIVKTKYGRPCVIEWLSTICFVGFDLRPEVSISKYKQPDGYDLYNSDNLEVIGNIYDNPELLKED